jgi:hypothetical protein
MLHVQGSGIQGTSPRTENGVRQPQPFGVCVQQRSRVHAGQSGRPPPSATTRPTVSGPFTGHRHPLKVGVSTVGDPCRHALGLALPAEGPIDVLPGLVDEPVFATT